MTYIHPASTAPFLLSFRLVDITFDLQFINTSSSKYKNFVAFIQRQLITHLAPFVTAANVIFIRYGSVEVSVALTIRDGDAPRLERELQNRNRSGLLGNYTWTASFWDLSCLPPEVHLQNLPSLNNKRPAVAILRSNDFIVQGNVLKTSCNSSNTLLFKWFLTSYSVNKAGETKIKETTLLDVTGTQWNLPKLVLDYGTYYVDFRAAFTSNPKMFGSTLGFFTIEKSPLRAKISGGNTVTKGKGKTITLNGSLSQDPDVEPGNITSMNFTWLCKKRNESFPNLSFPIPVVSLTRGPGQGGGCFGTGVGRLSSNRAVVNLSTIAMNCRKIPDMVTTCIINCGQTTTNARISLTTTCLGDACKSAKYQWLLASLHPPDNKEMAITLTRNMTETELNLPGIIIKKDALAGNVAYRLKVSVTQAHGPAGVSSYQFRMNAPPEGGQCTVKPLNGSALTTLFNIQCSGWKDSEKPLTYQFQYKTAGGLYTVVSYGSEDHVETVLPQGQKDNFTFEFSVTIKDKLFAETTVGPPPLGESFSYNALGNSSRFIKLLQIGDVMGATHLANAIKSFIVEEVSNVEVGNLQALTQVTSVIARATLEPDQVTVDTQAIALQSLSSLTSLFRNKTREDYASESTLVEEGGENLLLSLGNVLNSAAQKASSEGVSAATEKLIDEVGTTLLLRMVVDQEPNKVKTSSLDMVLNRLSPRSLKTNREYVEDDVGFKVPFEAITGEKAKDTQFVDFLMTLSAFNPFTWDATSASVKSHVLSLVLKDQDGKLLKVENSEKEVELKIKRDPRPEPKAAKESFFAKPSKNEKMQYHKIDLPHATGNALRLRVKPTGSNVFRVFVRHGQRPTVTEYDAERKVPDGRCSLSSLRNCDDAAYDFLLVDSILGKPGSYYIGILYDNSEQERMRKRKRRSCFGKRRWKRSCVEFKELPKPENITLIPVYDPKTDVNYSMNVEEEECLFWNRKAERWQSNGCKVGSNSTTTSLQCLCNHLTSFGGGILVMPNKLDFDMVFNELTRIHETGNVAVLCTIIAALLLYFLVCVFARRADKKDRAKTGPPLNLNSTLEEGFQYQLTIVTGVWMNSGTDANVTIVIHGRDASQSMKMQPLHEEEIEQARRYRVKEAKMFSFGRELFLYLFFLTLLTIVCYGNRSYHGYLITNDLHDTYVNFSLAKDPRSYWKWLRGQFVNGIYANEWYNGKIATKQDYINNKKSILLGMPRLRQIRIKTDACNIPEVARASIQHCYDYYSIDEEEKNPHNLPGWEPFRGSSNWANFSNLCPAPWNYVPQEKLHGSPSWGFFDIYSGGGYVADLGYNKTTASPLIANLQKYGWIDRQTRAVVLEFVVYNGNTGYLSISSFYYEILPIGCGHPFAIIDTFPLTSTQTGFYDFFLICQLLFIILVILFVFREAYAIYQLRCTYFRDPWNFVELFQIMFSFLVVIFYVVKSKAVLNSTIKVKDNPFVSVSFRDAVLWNDAENVMLAITVFITTVKMLRMIRFNQHIRILMSSFRESGGLLLSYSIIFIIIFLAYAQLGMLILGSHMREYSSFSNALVTEFLMCLGSKMSLQDLTRVNRVLGPLFGFSFLLLNAFIFVNFFVAILNDTHAFVKQNIDKHSEEYEMGDFILDRLQEFLGFRKNPLCDSLGETEDDKQESEMKGMSKTAFSSVAFQSHQLRRRARKIQLRNVAKSKENTTKKEKRHKNRLKEERGDSSDFNQAATEEERHHSKSNDTEMASLIPLNETTVLSRLGTLTSKVARDNVSEDIEMLSLIRLTRYMEDLEKEKEEATDVGDAMSEKEAQLDDIEVVSYVTTPNPSPSACPNTCDDISSHSVSSEELNEETTQLLRQLNDGRRLPEHLTGKRVQQNLRAALTKQSITKRLRWRH
ncbi:Polycystin-2 [Acropora cervicornis]|uniref:Polycystin-2 n=1 Tax=Acropora cervicornis TaxID=6130 RepID=A0AAD9R2L0_ACRCE|nr:Polycystin-2 [Acropora cervicornis]